MESSRTLALGCALALTAACGGTHVTCGDGTKLVGNQCVSLNALPDPILGAWLRADSSTQIETCEFFGDGQWDDTCSITGAPRPSGHGSMMIGT